MNNMGECLPGYFWTAYSHVSIPFRFPVFAVNKLQLSDGKNAVRSRVNRQPGVALADIAANLTSCLGYLNA